MRKHVVVDKETGNINSIQRWGDDREFPPELLSENEELITLADGENPTLKPDCFRYNHATSEFIEFIPEPSGLQTPSEIELLKVEIQSLKNRMTAAELALSATV